jgi:hypothetical protein
MQPKQIQLALQTIHNTLDTHNVLPQLEGIHTTKTVNSSTC